MSTHKRKKHKTLFVILIVAAVLLIGGIFAYSQMTTVVSQKLVEEIIAADNSGSDSTVDAQNFYDSMNTEDQETVKEIVSNHMTIAEVKEATEYLQNDDMEGLKEYAYDNLSDDEIEDLKALYEKYTEE